MSEKTLFSAPLRVGKIIDNKLLSPFSFVVIQDPPKEISGNKQEEIVCTMSGGDGEQIHKQTLAFAAVPELIQCLDDHCFYCADCDYENNPDQTCQFGRCWKKLRGEK